MPMTSLLPDKHCSFCPRLVEFRAQNQKAYPVFFNGAVPSFGELSAEFLVVGLAPGLKGANATGRPFTGDYAGEVLYPALIKAGFASSDKEFRIQNAGFRGKGDLTEFWSLNPEFTLINTRITNAVRCVPPENKPTPAEIKQCNGFLKTEIAAMPNLKVILTLGLVSHNAVLKALGIGQQALVFKHGAIHPIPDSRFQILNSYHTSRYNINTGRLTEAMFASVINKAKELLMPCTAI